VKGKEYARGNLEEQEEADRLLCDSIKAKLLVLDISKNK